jgi:hypothetical protein
MVLMAKLTPLESERLDVAELAMHRLLQAYKLKPRKGNALSHLHGLEQTMNLLSVMRLK